MLGAGTGVPTRQTRPKGQASRNRVAIAFRREQVFRQVSMLAASLLEKYTSRNCLSAGTGVPT